MLPYTFPVKVVMNAFEATILPVRVVAEMVNALMVLDPAIDPIIFEATTLPLRVVAEMVNALMVFDP
jgi:hypothetical protein